MTGKLPTFVIIGSAKCGTTSLASYLAQHPDVFMSKPKEPHFFTHGWSRGVQSYRQLFAHATEPIRGEASTSYTQAPHGYSVPRRMASIIPEAKLIYILREPMARIRSQYVHWVNGGKEYRSADDAISTDPRYIEHTRYAAHIRLFCEHYQRSQILILANEDLRAEPRIVVDQVFRFIGADPTRLPSLSSRELNRSAEKRRTLWALRAFRTIATRQRLLRWLPNVAKKKLHRLSSLPISSVQSDISPRLEAELWGSLGSDLRELRAYVPEFFPDWKPKRS